MFVYTGIRVRDLDRSRRFYVEGLGLRPFRSGRTAAGNRWEQLKDPVSESILELNLYPDAPGYKEGDELDHLGFRVASVPDSIAVLQRLGASVKIPPFEDSGSRYAFVADPDGVWVELFQRLEPDEAPTSQSLE